MRNEKPFQEISAGTQDQKYLIEGAPPKYHGYLNPKWGKINRRFPMLETRHYDYIKLETAKGFVTGYYSIK